MTPEQKEAAMRLGSALAYGEYVRKFNPGHKASVELDDLRTVLDALATARPDALEEAAKVADDVDKCMVALRIRALAASQPAPAAERIRGDERARFEEWASNGAELHRHEGAEYSSHMTQFAWAAWQARAAIAVHPAQPAPADDTGQAVAWQYRWRPVGREEWSEWVDGRVPVLPSGTYETHERPLYTHPAPLDAERVREDAFKLGFMCSAEGYNGEYPFEGNDVEKDGNWLSMRRAALRQQEGG